MELPVHVLLVPVSFLKKKNTQSYQQQGIEDREGTRDAAKFQELQR
jgi:hypothetical protein